MKGVRSLLVRISLAGAAARLRLIDAPAVHFSRRFANNENAFSVPAIPTHNTIKETPVKCTLLAVMLHGSFIICRPHPATGGARS